MSDFNVVVIGGGPVGLATAINAAKAKFQVAVLEPRVGAIDKACGEGLMPGTLPLLKELGIEVTGEKLMGVTYSNGSISVSHRFKQTYGLGVRRTELQTALRNRATELGITFIEDSFDSLSQNQSLVSVVTTSGKHINADYVFAADGLHSTVAKKIGLSKPVSRFKTKRFGIRQHFETPPWSDCIQVFYTPEAELYITPVSKSEIGLAILGSKNVNFENVIRSIPEVWSRIENAKASSQRMGAGSFPQQTIRRTKGRVLLVGDAAGYVDAITGEGLRLGFAQAKAAVAAVANGKPQSYEKQWLRVSRDFRVLTNGLAFAATSKLRGFIVPLASRLPRVFGLVVDRLAK